MLTTATTVKKEESEFEINVNAKYVSLRATVVLFKAIVSGGIWPDVKYSYQNMKNLKIDVDGITNQVHNSDYLAQYGYDDAMRLFDSKSGARDLKITQESFYNSNYALVIDLRTIKDEGSGGIGRQIKEKIKVSKDVTSEDTKAFTYLIYGKAVEFTNNMLHTIES